MTNPETNKALDAVRKHLQSMLDKLEKMKVEQEEDLQNIAGSERQQTEIALQQTKKLIDEIKKSLSNLEATLTGKKDL